MIKLTCETCNSIVWPWQEQASFGRAGYRWWNALSRWHTSCLARSSSVPADWAGDDWPGDD